MATVTADRVSKMYGGYTAVAGLDLEVRDGEFLVLVGPSGCGKTTTLRMLAGLETPTYGRILIDGEDVTLLPPGRRDVAMVFQSYALYPHMSVYKNLAFGPEVRGESKKDLPRHVQRVADLVGLGQLLDRRPSALSGGQRQRIALGRAMMREPRLFLLDEPLSNLDAGLRTQMRSEISSLQRKMGITTVYVTHDQVEAMTMGHRIAVFAHGRLEQIDTPEGLYRSPKSRAVAEFIGSPRMNLFGGTLSAGNSQMEVRCLNTAIPMPSRHGAAIYRPAGTPLSVGIRPQDVHWIKDAPSRCTQAVSGIIQEIESTGAETFVVVQVAQERLNTRFPSFARISLGDQVELVFDIEDVHLFDAVDGTSLLHPA